MPSRTFRVEDANQTLPLVRRIAVDVVRATRELAAETEAYHRLRGRRDRAVEIVAELSARKLRIATLTEEIEACLAELREIGVEMPDRAAGVVEFPAELDDRPVLLSWRPDEPQVEYWRERADAVEARRPLPVAVPR